VRAVRENVESENAHNRRMITLGYEAVTVVNPKPKVASFAASKKEVRAARDKITARMEERYCVFAGQKKKKKNK
jgi:hypothetical protein